MQFDIVPIITEKLAKDPVTKGQIITDV